MFDCVVSICSTCVVVLMIFSEFAFISLFAHGFLNGTGLVENSLQIVTKKKKEEEVCLPVVVIIMYSQVASATTVICCKINALQSFKPDPGHGSCVLCVVWVTIGWVRFFLLQ